MSLRSITVLFCLFCFSAKAQLSFAENNSLLINSDRSYIPSAVVDMNNDGKDDIVRVSEEGNLTIFWQTSPGALFESLSYDGVFVGDDTRPWGMSVADFNEDGMNDVVVGGKYNQMKIITQATNNSGFWMSVADGDDIFVQGMNCFDVDNDGHIDIFSCNDDGISKVLLNDGTGVFEATTNILQAETDTPSDNSGNYGSCFVDVNNNGHCDLYIAKCRQGVNDPADPRRINLLYTNDGQGNWESEGIASGTDIGWQTWSADFGDTDNDGDMDLFMTNHDHVAIYMENDGAGNFEDKTVVAGLEDAYTFTPTQSSFQDFDNDGFIDILVTGGMDNSFCMNNGDGTFTVIEEIVDYRTNSYSLGDLDHDGKIDIYAIQGGYGASGFMPEDDKIFLNTSINNNNYFKVRLEGTVSNFNGIGARVKIVGDWGEQIRDVKSGESYGIMCSLNQNFGLATATMVENVQVTWPSGLIENFGSYSANSFETLVEGTGTLLGISDLDKTELYVYPNPTSDLLNISLPNFVNYEKDSFVRIVNALGDLVLNSKMRSQIDVSALAPGNYIVEIIEIDQIISTKKIVIR